jgi:hypothetical protein
MSWLTTCWHYLASRARTALAAEQERFNLLAERDELRRAHRALKAEHERLLRVVGIDAVIDQTIDLEAARSRVSSLTAEVELLTAENSELRWENIRWVRQSVEGPS